MPDRTVLVAHRTQDVRDRFAAALADARHAFALAGDAAAAREAVTRPDARFDLLLVDLGLVGEGVPFVRSLSQLAGRAVPVVVFADAIPDARTVAALAAMGISGYVNDHATTPDILRAIAPHLFPDSFNRRLSPRVTLGVPVSYRTGETLAGAVTLDVAKGGLAIRTMEPLPTGSLIELRFRLPGIVADIDASGRVAWSDRKVGMGVEFDQIAAADQAAIDAFVDHHHAA